MMPELPPNLELALGACEVTAQTTRTGEVWFHAIPKEYQHEGVSRHDLVVLAELGYLTQTGETSRSLGNTRYRLTPRPELIEMLFEEAVRLQTAAANRETENQKALHHREQLIHFPEAFDWWRKRYHGRRFPFECECKSKIGVLQRVTQTKRRCPNCGELITTQAIDDQLTTWEPERQRTIETEKKSGLVSTLGTIGVVAAAGVMYGASFFFGKKR